jgi:multidrug efflux system membrane fusion protein
MARIRFHMLAAATVFALSAAWVLTGEISTVGSASRAETKPAEKAAPAAPARTVAVVRPPHLMHARAIRISGQTEADKRASLAVRWGGIVARKAVEQGDWVKKGDLIIGLDGGEKEAAAEMAKQVLAQRQAEADAARRLAKTGNIAKLSLDNAMSALAAAQSQLKAALADIERTEVLAPFDGLVDRIDAEQGSYVQANAVVATILALDPVIAVGEVSERDIGAIRIGDKADVKFIDGKSVTGRIRYMSRDASPQTRTFRVEVAIPNPDHSIPAGMTAEITLYGTPVDATILPRSVVTLDAKGDLGIRVVGPDDKASFHPIELVDDMPDGLALAGIPKDARVIVKGQDLVKDGDTVNPVEADAETVRHLSDATGTE